MENPVQSACRVCAEDCGQRQLRHVSIYERKDGDGEQRQHPTLAEMLAFCGQLTITNDDQLPKIICTICCQQLLEAYQFCLKCRLSDEKLRDRLRFTEQLQQLDADGDQQIPDRIVDDLIELPTAKPKAQNEILVDLMMRREDELFDEIIEQEQFSADEDSVGESLMHLVDKVPVEVVTVDGGEVMVEEVDSQEDDEMVAIDQTEEDDLITISEHVSDMITEASDSSVQYEEITLTAENDGGNLPTNISLSRRTIQVLPPKEMIVELEDHENFQIVYYNGVACCGCEKYFSSQVDLEEHCQEQHHLDESPDGTHCPLCHKQFRSLNIQMRHMNQRSIPKLFSCKLCRYICRDQAAIDRHMEFSVIHKKPMMDFDKVTESFEKVSVEGHLCCDCYQMFRDETQLDKHYKDAHHPNRPKTEEDALKTGSFWCTKCHQIFKHEHRYQSHLNGINVEAIYRCKREFCTYRTGSIIFARFHLRSRDHKLPTSSPVDKKSPKAPGILSDRRCCFRKCLEVFETKQSLLEHVDRVHQVKQLENELRRKKSTHVCSICNCNFGSRRALKRHRLVKAKDIVCEQCGSAFASTFQLQSHVRQVHSNVPVRRDFKCDECGRAFVSETNLQRHKELGHDKPSDNVCSICDKQFKSKENLWHHWRIHNKVETHECESCKKAGKRYKFRDLKTLRRHFKISEMHNGERKYKCSYEGCKRAYAHKPDLQRHEQTVHRGIRPFLCEVCNKGFVRNRDLRLHERQHTGAKLFTCENCKAEFNVFKDYKKHCSDEHGKMVVVKYAARTN
ncbi:zinc finger protein 16-like [Ochlerotatus camptorhynchus]|uniref:zinc finger protein 16-like n=1 Tax=Ochlerotatus camptorhynchus TaxID=644619 RepID=UPI0031DF57FD